MGRGVGRRGRAGRTGPDRAGLGHTAGRNLVARTTIDWKIDSRTEIRNGARQTHD
jgi:hypothetical protein